MSTPFGALSGLTRVPLARNRTSSVWVPKPPGGGRMWNRHSNGDAPEVVQVNVGTTGVPVEASKTVALMFTPAGTLSNPINTTSRGAVLRRMNGGAAPPPPTHLPGGALLAAS